MVYTWIAVAIVSVLVELWLRDRVAIWVLPAAALSFVLALIPVYPWVQALVFAAVALFGILVVRRILVQREKKARRGSIDSVIGETCVVTEHIENLAGIGQVEIHGMYWAARSYHDDVIYMEGDVVTVLAVEGVKVIVRD